MEKTKRNWLLTGLLAFVMMFGLCLGFGLGGSQVQTVYAAENPKATASQVTINGLSPLSWSGVTFEDGVLTIDSSFPNNICDAYQPAQIEVKTSVTADLTVVINKKNFYAIFANLNGNLTIEGNDRVYTYETYVGGNLTIKATMFDIVENTSVPFLLSTSSYHSRNSIVYTGEKISIEGSVSVSGVLSSSSKTRSLLCAKSLEINNNHWAVRLATESTKGNNKQAPIVIHSCNSANDLAGKLVIRQGTLRLEKYYDTEDTQYNDYFGFVGYTSNSNGAISNSNTNFDTENKAFTGYEILETNTDLIVKARKVNFGKNGGTGDNLYSWLPLTTEPRIVTLPECPYTAPAGKQFAGWALESATATPLKQPGDTFVLEDGGYEYDSSNYYSNYYYIYAIWEDIPADALTGTVAINGNLKFGATLTASLTNTNNTGTLSYQWRRNGSEIAEATNNTYTLTQDDIGYTMSVVVSSNVETGSLTATATEIVAKADGPVAPTGITATACTTADNNNGSISGITTAMEYKLSGASEWTDGTGATITGLNNGTYLVRLKETATHNAGEQATVVVNAYNAPLQYGITVNKGTSSANTAVAGTTITITANAPETGYVFAGWTSTDGVVFTDENNMATTFNMPSKNVTVTATYQLMTLSITFNANGGTGTKASVQVSYGNNYTLPENPFTAPEGKEFDGWALSATGAKIDGTTINITENTELFALWKDVEIAPETKGGLSAGAVVGIILGVVAVGGLGGLAIVWFVVRKKTFADLIAIIKRK